MNLVVQRYNNFLNYTRAEAFLAEKTVGAEFVSVSNSETPVIPAAYGRFASLPQAGETDFTNREGGTGVISNPAGMAE